MIAWLLAAMLVTSIGNEWVIHFAADARNTEVVVYTECKGKEPFVAYDSVPILDDDQTEVRARKQHTPRGARCTVEASVMRYRDDNPNHDVIAESVIIIQEDK